MSYAEIGPISVFLPERKESIDDLREEFPNWSIDLIYEKTGIHTRHIAADDEYASDLGVKATEKLFAEHDIDPQSVDFLLFCTQTPDYPLPTTACMMQQRLGLRTGCGALDFNLGCSAYAYGLGLADGLIQSGVAKRVLFVTGETYTKYIDAADRSLRTIFGDGATATLIDAKPEQSIKGLKFGTDGDGANMLLLTRSGVRDCIPPRGRHRWKSDLYMDGPGLISFTMDAIPQLVDQILESAGVQKDDIDQFLLHQATRKMLDELRKRLHVDESQVPVEMELVGNTVSSTLPILIEQLRREGRINPESQHLLVGFGVGLSWAGCVWQDTWSK